MMSKQHDISDATWLLLWQVWRSPEIMTDFYSMRDVVGKLLDLELEQEDIVQPMEPVSDPKLVCICGKYIAPIKVPAYSLLLGCYECMEDKGEQFRQYIAYVYHTLASEHDICITSFRMERMLASTLHRRIGG